MQMSYQTILPIWNALRNRFQKNVEGLPEDIIHMKLGDVSVGSLLYHTAEVEYMFSGWFFDKPMEDPILQPTHLKGYIRLLKHSNKHVLQAIKDLPDESWDLVKQSSFGESTPLEAVGRLMNHTAMHGGQISLIQRYGRY